MSHVRLLCLPPPGDAVEHACLTAFQSELDYIYQTLRRFGASRFDIDDLAQDLFMILRRTWSQYDQSRPLRPYLFGIAFRITAAHKRKRHREVPCGVVEIDDSAPGPDDELGAKRLHALLFAALERVPLTLRAMLIMHELDQVPVADVAEAFSVPLFTAYSRLRRARHELQVAFRRVARGVKVNASIG